jgi:hypothetical protein
MSDESKFSETYFVRSLNSYSLTDPNWRVCDDVLFLKSIEKYNFKDFLGKGSEIGTKSNLSSKHTVVSSKRINYRAISTYF